MEVINIEATDETPQVKLDATNNMFEFSGRSLPEDVTTFYNPILDWLDAYALEPNGQSTFVFKMDYFNTASSKLILDILMKLEEINDEHDGISVEWHYQEDDEDMEEAGEEYADIVEIPFKQVAYE